LYKYSKKIDKYRGADDSDFKSFLIYLKNGGLYKDQHWMPQVSFMWPTVGRVDFVGKVESLDRDMRTLLRKLYGDDYAVDHESISSIRKGPPVTDSSNAIDEFYDKECRLIVQELYRADFEQFGYSV